MKKPVVDYRAFRLRKINEPQFAHSKLLLGWVGYFILYFLTENLIPVENCHPVYMWLDDVIPFCEWFLIPYVFWYALIVGWLKEKGIRVVLATNPLFPSIATENRIRWAGLQPEDFEYFTTFENSHYCKPNLDYYQEILEKRSLKPEECLMVGNDVGEDMITEQLGMKTFLLTDCLINKENKDISQYPNGGFAELDAYLKELLL